MTSPTGLYLLVQELFNPLGSKDLRCPWNSLIMNQLFFAKELVGDAVEVRIFADQALWLEQLEQEHNKWKKLKEEKFSTIIQLSADLSTSLTNISSNDPLHIKPVLPTLMEITKDQGSVTAAISLPVKGVGSQCLFNRDKPECPSWIKNFSLKRPRDHASNATSTSPTPRSLMLQGLTYPIATLEQHKCCKDSTHKSLLLSHFCDHGYNYMSWIESSFINVLLQAGMYEGLSPWFRN